MKRLLVVGGTGQLGNAILQKAIASGRFQVFLLLRPDVKVPVAVEDKVIVLRGDLGDHERIRQFCTHADIVVATASSVFPRRKCDSIASEDLNYRNLVMSCVSCDVEQFVFVSAVVKPDSVYASKCGTFRAKLQTESLLRNCSMQFTVLRCAPFMEEYFALIGSQIPGVGEINPTLDRAQGLTKVFLRLTRASIERRGLAWIPGSSAQRHSFISIQDVSKIIYSVLGEPSWYCKSIEVYGPSPLSWGEVVSLYEAALKRRIRILKLPKCLLRLTALLRPLFPALENQLCILLFLSEVETIPGITGNEVDRIFGSVTASEFISGKVKMWQQNS